MKQWIRFPRTSGNTSRQAHCDLPEGTFEREFGREGFFGPMTHMYHTHAPTGWVEWEGELRPRAFDTVKMANASNCPSSAKPLFHNKSIRVRFWRTEGKMDHLFANGDGDDMLFIHAGSGHLFCDFGHMEFKEGDYILLPRSTRWRLECDSPTAILMMEATNDSYKLPDKGMVGEHAIFDPAMFDVPEIDEAYKAQYEEKPWQVVIKCRDTLSKITYPFNPLDIVGWKGDNLPVKINWRDIRPLMSARYHLPPSAHTTFLCNRFVICTFVPRPFESDPGALKVPFYHSNNDFDEIIFYHAGNFFSRDNIHPGMMTLHPGGFPHGPHPGAMKNAFVQKSEATEEVAVMIDTRDAVEISKDAHDVEWKEYLYSWKEKK
ncbi:MAG: homogentisate 1,2-dioxygenase [Rickettsiales bacterium]